LNRVIAAYKHENAVLDCCFSDSDHTLSGGLDNTLVAFDLKTQKETIIGYHDNAIRCVNFDSLRNVIITGSWDNTVKLWDPRVAQCVGTFSQPGCVYTMDIDGNDSLIVGTSERNVLIWSLRNMKMNQVMKRISPLKYQTRCIRFFSNRKGYAISSIEGRVGIEYLDENKDAQKMGYAFKCHRVKSSGSQGGEKVYPVNSIAFHKVHNTFATGGSDCFVNIWDGLSKKRLCQFHEYPTSISSLAFDSAGKRLAIATSTIYASKDEFENDNEFNIYIRSVSDAETKPK
jgi:cell cycle arrest protein BUB3